MRKFYCEETRFSKGKIAGIIACIQTNGYKSSGIVFHRLENYDEERKVYIYIYRCFFPSLNIVEWKKEKKKKGRNEEEAAIGSPLDVSFSRFGGMEASRELKPQETS